MERKSQEDSATEINNYDLFKAIQKIRDIIEHIIDKHLSSNKKIMYIEKGREGWAEPNPFFGQTEKGLLLHVVNGDPGMICTPWGGVKLIGAIAARENTSITLKLIAEEFFTHFETKLHSERTDGFGWNTKLYKILTLDGTKLIEPLEINEPKDHIELNDAWKKLEQHYKTEFSTSRA